MPLSCLRGHIAPAPDAAVAVDLPIAEFDHQRIRQHTLENGNTPVLLGIDTLEKFGLVIDYKYGTVYSHELNRMLNPVRLPSGHLAIPLQSE